jgi:hypothetical protein
MGTIIFILLAFGAGLYFGHRSGGRRALWRLHTGNYREMIRRLGL